MVSLCKYANQSEIGDTLDEISRRLALPVCGSDRKKMNFLRTYIGLSNVSTSCWVRT